MKRMAVVLVLVSLSACDGGGATSSSFDSASSSGVEARPAGSSLAGGGASATAVSIAPDAHLRAVLRAPDLILDRQRLESLGTDAALATAFNALLSDPSCSVYERTRILSAARWVDDPRIPPLLQSVATDAARSAFERRTAIKSYGWVAGEAALPTLQGLAAHPDRHTREAVLRAVGRIDAPDARRLLEARARDESEADLRHLARRVSTP